MVHLFMFLFVGNTHFNVEKCIKTYLQKSINKNKTHSLVVLLIMLDSFARYCVAYTTISSESVIVAMPENM